jgi:putative MATE family efflux protein
MKYSLTQGSASRHVRRLAVPAAAGLFCNTLFNITDAFYAGWLATEAQAALAFSFPLFFILLSCCVGLSQAITARIAKAVGAKRLIRARYLAGQSLVLGVLVCVMIWITLLPLADILLRLMGASGQTHAWGLSYSLVIFAGAPAFIGAFVFNGILHAVGNTRAYRNSIAVATMVNIILDPALMFGWFGLLALGVAGVAWATVIAQAGCALYMLYTLSRTIIAKRWHWMFLIPRWRIISVLAGHASAPTTRMLCINSGFFIVTGFLGYVSDSAVAAYGIALRLEQLFLLPTIGLEVAMLTYAGQNFGAGQSRRVRIAYHFCIKCGWAVNMLGAVTMVFLGGQLIGLFNTDASVVTHGQHYLWLAAGLGPFYVLISIITALLLAAAHYKVLLVMNVLRQLIVPAALFYLLAVVLNMGVAGIWLSMFICNVVAAIVMFWYCQKILVHVSR